MLDGLMSECIFEWLNASVLRFKAKIWHASCGITLGIHTPVLLKAGHV